MKPSEGKGISSKEWRRIAEQLNRMPRQCQQKWEYLKYEPKGHYAPEEDARILQGVKDWEDNKTTKLWSFLAHELQRPASSVSDRYTALVARRVLSSEARDNGTKATFWNERMVRIINLVYVL